MISRAIVASLLMASIVSAGMIDRETLFGPLEKEDLKKHPNSEDYKVLARELEKRLKFKEINDTDIKGITEAAEELIEDWFKENRQHGLVYKLLSGSKPPPDNTLFSYLVHVAYMCNQQGYTVMGKNYKLALGKRDYLDGKTKLETCILQAMKTQSEFCRSAHIRDFDLLLTEIKPSIIADVDRFFDPNLVSQIIGTEGRSIVLQKRGSIVGKLLGVAGKLLDKVIELARETEAAKYFTIDEAKNVARIDDVDNFHFNTAFEQLIGPCREYVLRFSEIFRSARFDLVLDDSKIDQITKGDPKFESYWIKYQLCEAIWLESDKIVGAMIEVAAK